VSHTETTEEFLARGGKISKCKEPLDYPIHKYAVRLLRAVRNRARAAARAKLSHGRKERKNQNIGAVCDLNYQWIRDRLDKGICEATGIKFDYSAEQDGFTNPWAPSIDRIDSMRGYTKDNCQVVVWIYNRAKGEDSHEDVKTLAKALMERD
jgi:hypothetical protein